MQIADSERVERLEAKVTGMVQGVGYRFFAAKAGRRLVLAGFARNLPDGSVEVVAEGPRWRLDALLSDLGRGPHAGRVDNVESAFQPASGEFAGFDIRY